MRAKHLATSISAIVGVAGLAFTVGGAGIVGADGTETLGPPSIPISEGSGVVVAGVGLELIQPGTIDIDVPVGATVEQVLLYWEGQSSTPTGDETIEVNATEVTGVLIGGPTLFFEGAYSSTYRADITSLGAVSAGANSVAVGGLSFDYVNNGAGLAVIYDDGTTADIRIVDGNDLAFINFEPTLDTTVAQTFTFPSAEVDRVASLSLFFSSVTGPASGGGDVRPSTIRAISGGVVSEGINLLDSNDGDEWDSDTFEVNIPAGATELTVQALSEDATGDGQDPLAASFAWNAATLAVPVPPPPPTTPTTVPDTTTPDTTVPETTTPPTVAPTTAPPETPTDELPATGRSPWLAVGAAAALLAGIVLTLAARRPRGAHSRI